MEPKSPQFSAYDFLGYLLPGLVLVGLLDCSWHYHAENAPMGWADITKRYSKLSWENAIPLAFLGYFSGHIVSFISSVIIEGHATRLHGNPSVFLVKHFRPRYFFSGDFKKNWFRVPAKFLLKIFVLFFIWPVGWIESFLGSSLGMSRLLNTQVKPIARMCLTAAEDQFLKALDVKNPRGKRPARKRLRLHWSEGLGQIGLHYALEMAPAHVYSLRNYVVLYGFLRAMTFILLVVTWVIAIHAISDGPAWKAMLYWAAGGLMVAPCYGAYLKFWTRYQNEAIMAFIAASAVAANKNQLETDLSTASELSANSAKAISQK